MHQFKKSADTLPLILPYLKSVQKDNIAAVNEAVNSLLVEEEDVDSLRTSISEYGNFDQPALAVVRTPAPVCCVPVFTALVSLSCVQRLEKHDLLELRRVAALLYKRNKRWEASIALSKSDMQYKDAIDTAAESGNQDLCEGLLAFFVNKGDKEVRVLNNMKYSIHSMVMQAFAAALFTCYHLVRADVALELAWRNRMLDYAMPFMIQFVRDAQLQLATLEARTKPKEEHSAEAVPGLGGEDQPVLMLANEAYNQGYGQVRTHVLIHRFSPCYTHSVHVQPGGYGIPQPGGYGAPGGMPGMPQPGAGGGFGVPGGMPFGGAPAGGFGYGGMAPPMGY